MYDSEQIIGKLGIQDWPADRRDQVVEVATYRIGNAVTEQMTDQQLDEYEAIIDDDHAVIDAWLAQNEPDYKNSPIYQEIEAGYEADPEKNNPAKLFASIAWIQKNVPDVQGVIDRTLEEYRQELSAA